MFDKEKLSHLKEARQRWEVGVLAKTLSKAPESKAEFKTVSGSVVKRLYTPEDIEDIDYERDLGYPGQYPFTRGYQPTMYRGRPWTMRMYAGFATAEESNERYKYLVSQGSTGLSVAFDLPTQIGYDSDHPLAQGEVGKVGVAIDSLRDMEILFDGIPLDKVSTSMTINALRQFFWQCILRLRKSRECSRQVEGHHPKRHIEGIYSKGNLHLSNRAVHEAYYRYI